MDGVWNPAWGWALLAGGTTLAAAALAWRLRPARAEAAPTPAPDLDALTGVPTRRSFDERLDDTLATSDREQRPLALMSVGLDNFRTVNDACGREAGDRLLAAVPGRLRDALPQLALLARQGGDEFLALVWGARDEAHEAAARVLAELRRPHAIAGQSLCVDASVGMALYMPGGDGRRLLTQALAAMRFVKRNGGGAHAEFQPAMAVDLRRQAELLRDLRLAVERRALQLVYQPKVDAQSLDVTGVEALLRWHDERRGLVGPEVFLPLAEKHGLMADIGRWVLDEAMRQAAQWRDAGLRLRVAVNLSAWQLRQPELLQQLCDGLQQHGIAPACFGCEIAEAVAMEDSAATQAAFARLRSAGVQVSIDDFGSGRPSLATLRTLPASELKIDRSVVGELASSPEARSVAAAVIRMAHRLDLRVVAEGVETEAQRDWLLEEGCDELQGWLIAKPMAAHVLAVWVGAEPQPAAPSADGPPPREAAAQAGDRR